MKMKIIREGSVTKFKYVKLLLNKVKEMIQDEKTN